MNNKKYTTKNYMKSKFILIGIITFLVGKVNAQSQQNTNSFSLQQAIEYAYKNSPNYLNAQNEVLMAKYKRKEVLGMAMPQINTSVDFKDFEKIPTSVLPNFVSPAVYGGLVQAGVAPYDEKKLSPSGYEPIAAQFGTKYQATGSASASLLVFSADYLVGLKITKEMVGLTNINVIRTKAETYSAVSKAYYSVLINRERLKSLDANVVKLGKLLQETKEINKQGLVEKIDVDRLEVSYNNLLTEKLKIERFAAYSESVLKFQMGYVGKDNITLTDSLSVLDNSEIDASKINVANNPTILQLQAMQHVNEVNVKRLKYGYLPMLIAYGSMGYQGLRGDMKFFDKSNNWYPTASVGGTLSFSIFDGLQRHYRIQQAKLEVTKSELTVKNVQLATELESSMAAINFNNSISSLQTQKRNLELAQSIYTVSEKKYEQGVGSNLEVLNAQTSLREAETNYYSAVYDLLFYKIDYLKATGNLVK